MSKHHDALPQLGGTLFLTDSGMETFFCFQEGIDLPDFASFPLLDTEDGRNHIASYLRRHAAIARDAKLGFVLETPTWRANADWGARLGYDKNELDRINRDAVQLMFDIRAEYQTPTTPIIVSGNIGPRGDGYNPEELLQPDTAQDYHSAQIETFADAGADIATALTITHSGEAIGIVRASQAADIPSVISFTTETDGLLPNGQSIGDAIEDVDTATDGGPAYYMINCAHPTHYEDALDAGAEWVMRIRGMRANASTKSHEELDNSTELDQDNPTELGAQYREIRKRLPHISVLGGCCGTDHRHVEAICMACAA